MYVILEIKYSNYNSPIPVAAWSKAQVCGRSLARVAGSNSVWGVVACLLWILYFVK